MSVARWLATLVIALAASGCVQILGLDSGEPIADEAGTGAVDVLPSEASVSDDAAFVDAAVIAAETTDADPDTTDPGTAADASTLVCPPDKADCNGNDKDGCETNLDDPKHCGSCTNKCPPKSACQAETCCLNAHAECTTSSECCSGNCEGATGCH